MTEIEYIQEQIDNNRECLNRLMLTVAVHLPSTYTEVVDLRKKWERVTKEIEKEKTND